MDQPPAFRGFPRDALAFYDDLDDDNTRPFWLANRDRWEASVRAPMEHLLAELDEFGPFRVFRPFHDRRYVKDRPPYKTHQGAYGESEGGTGYYVQIAADGLMADVGYFAMATDQLARFRRSVDAPATGNEVVELVRDAERRGYHVAAVGSLKTAPRGYGRDHPRVELLRLKGLSVRKELGAPRWIHTSQAVARVRDCWTGVADLCAWLERHVGPSTLPPDVRPF